ncbi:MAG: hypothetical protein CMK07_10995 [Ponticaulis sp.]|nr:hypothetical protein [Ponticaulis sp.]
MTEITPRPTLFLIVGPNGAGKTTYYETVLKGRVAAPFINADIIQRDELKDTSMEAAYTAARIAEERRQQYLESRSSFIAETVFSHESKLGLIEHARQAGFRIIVFHLDVASADLSVARVHARVNEGGHPVPDDKIRARYERNKTLIRSAVLAADAAIVLDASALNQPPRRLARFSNGRIEQLSDHMTDWFEDLYGDLIVE